MSVVLGEPTITGVWLDSPVSLLLRESSTALVRTSECCYARRLSCGRILGRVSCTIHKRVGGVLGTRTPTRQADEREKAWRIHREPYRPTLSAQVKPAFSHYRQFAFLAERPCVCIASERTHSQSSEVFS